MRVSILIPTRNRVAYLKACLASARGQTHRDLEILVSDDGSSDGTREYVESEASHDPRVRLIVGNPTPGIFTNMQYLVSRAQGGAFCLLGDDDLIDATYVERLVAPMLQANDVVATFCDHRIIDASGDVMTEASIQSSVRYGRSTLAGGPLIDPVATVLRQSMCLGFSMYRTSVFASELFDLDCAGAADLDYLIRATRRGTLWYVPECLGAYRVHPGTATSMGTLKATGLVRALERHPFDVPRHEVLRKGMLRTALLDAAFVSSVENPGTARECARKYIALGGKPWHAKWVAAVGLSFAPPRVSRVVRLALRQASAQLRQRLRPSAS
jgi:GT2 family glycosyltransferase